MKALRDKVAVITGGGSGLGRELASCCARRGMHVVLADVDEAGMQGTLARLGEEAPQIRCLARRVDVAKLPEVEELAEFVWQQFGAAHLVFNNAGVSVNGPAWEYTEADWRWVLGVNLLGVAWGIKAFVPRLIAQGEGHVINTASAAGWMSPPGSGIYNATKAAVVSLSETLALDLKDAGASIGVTVLCPAFFPTAIVDAARNRPAELADTAPPSELRLRRQEQMRQAVERGRLSAAQIAEITLQAVEEGRFYVFPHPKVKALVRARAEAVEREHDPFDPLAFRPS
ncbi:SDR family NAD(P)-dependent oxidoreductase [Tepidiphilus olei]|uniref:SDR family NAD(P)-dependent oxidoreductase n=1 Tax=Tepidiphilus olei TaxID=2502184 RepID=UPI00115E359D|nr:SDR family NAD(P)-dependent oxidoreductase [Tepidiphilus olei]